MYSLTARRHRQDARSLFGRLARDHPVHWDPYTGVWLISGRDAARTACSDPRFSASRVARPAGDGAQPLQDRVHALIARQALFLDGPDHAVWQRILRRVLAPDRVLALTPWLQRRVAELVGPDGKLDIVDDLARPLPLEAIAELMGLPAADLPMIAAWSDAYTRIVTGFDPVTDERVFAEVDRFVDYAVELILARRESAADDGVGILVRAADAAGGLDDLDIASNLIMIVAAGHQTTTGFLSGAVLERLRPTGPPVPDDVTGSVAVLALLARVSPSRFVGRRVTEDVELAGQVLRAGDAALVLLAAVNWSEEQTGHHVAFGHGRHRCPGAALAQLEGEIVLHELFEGGRATTLVDEDISWSDNVNLPCPTHVEVTIGGPA